MRDRIKMGMRLKHLQQLIEAIEKHWDEAPDDVKTAVEDVKPWAVSSKSIEYNRIYHREYDRRRRARIKAEKEEKKRQAQAQQEE